MIPGTAGRGAVLRIAQLCWAAPTACSVRCKEVLLVPQVIPVPPGGVELLAGEVESATENAVELPHERSLTFCHELNRGMRGLKNPLPRNAADLD